MISRDEFKEGYINTVKIEHTYIANEEIKSINNAFFESILLLLKSNISCVAESAFQHKLWLSQYEALSEKAAVKLLICRTDKVIANRRFLDRKNEDPLREYFHGDSSISSENDEYEYTPPQFPVPVLEVDTTEGYKPNLEEIVFFIRKSG